MTFIIFLFVFTLFSNIISIQVFNVKSFHARTCTPSLGDIVIEIDGDFSESADLLAKVNLEFTTSEGFTIKSECSPFDAILNISEDLLQCPIDISLYYPLKDIDIFLQVDPPQESGYQFPNWKETIGSNPGVSNKISKINCLPKENNIFNVNSIKNNGCIGNKNSFTIYGTWENTKSLPSLDFDFQFFLENNRKDLVDCEYKIGSDSNSIDCKFEGEGNIKVDGQYFYGYFNTYQFNTYDSGLKFESCNKGNNNNSNNSYWLYFNLLNSLILILLLI